MSLIDKYILREWGKSFFLAALGILSVLLLEDMYDDLGDFIEFGAAFSDIMEYYVAFLPGFLPVIIPTAFLLSLLFTLGNLNRNHEILALKAAGLSVFKITRSLWVFAFILAGCLFYLNAQLVPWSVERSKAIWDHVRFQSQIEDSGTQEVGMLYLLGYDNKREGRLWYMNRLSEYTHAGYGISVFERDKFHAEKRRVLAQEGYFDEALGYWVFKKGREVQFDESGEPNRSVAFEEKKFPEFMDSPKLMAALSQKPENLSVWEMRALLKAISPAENAIVYPFAVSYARICLSPITCLIVIAIAIPFAVTGVRANPLVGVSKAIGLFFVYYLMVSISGIMGSQQVITPWVAASIPNVLILGFSLFLYRKLT